MGLQDDSKLALACLIPRLIDPKSGRVLVDGRDLREATLDSIRAQVATVLQADLVFTDSVLVNIGLGDPMNTLPRVIEAAKMTHAHHFIQDLPHGYDTSSASSAITSSPTSNSGSRWPGLSPRPLDPDHRGAESAAWTHDTQHFIDDTLARLSVGRTLIVIPHRLSSVRASDHVIVLHDGRVEDTGLADRSSRPRASSTAT